VTSGELAESHRPDFATGIAVWRRGLGLVRDTVRQELVHHQLMVHLPRPSASEPVRVLDVGCGQGTQALWLARSGYQVTGLDPSDELLALAEEALASEGTDVRDRVRLRQGTIEQCQDAGAPFDVVCCHGVVMYLPSLEEAARQLVAAVRPGGLVSVLSKNRANLAWRAAMNANWQGALAAFDAHSYTNRLGVDHARADDPDEVTAVLASLGADTLAWYGVRLFTDHWGDVEPPEDFEALVRAEQEAGRRDPYRRLAGATHVVAKRCPSSVPEVREATADDRDWLRAVISAAWGLPVVSGSGAHDPTTLSCLVAWEGDRRVGALTYRVGKSAMEVVTLNSLDENHGIGSILLAEAHRRAREAGLRLWLLTADNNVRAIAFYLRRGMEIVAVHRDFAQSVRAVKPSADIGFRHSLEFAYGDPR
jgi:S-adenosylmethionine-dependent methyltransferase